MEIEGAKRAGGQIAIMHFACYKSINQQEHEDNNAVSNKDQVVNTDAMDIIG